MLRKLLVRLNRVRRDANHFRASRNVVVPTIAHRTHLPRADRSFVAGIKKQHDNFAAMVRQAPIVAVSIFEREIRRGRVESWFVSSLDQSCENVQGFLDLFVCVEEMRRHAQTGARTPINKHSSFS